MTNYNDNRENDIEICVTQSENIEWFMSNKIKGSLLGQIQFLELEWHAIQNEFSTLMLSANFFFGNFSNAIEVSSWYFSIKSYFYPINTYHKHTHRYIYIVFVSKTVVKNNITLNLRTWKSKVNNWYSILKVKYQLWCYKWTDHLHISINLERLMLL